MFKNILNGRYGFDSLSLVLAIIGMVLLKTNFLQIIGIIFLGYSVFRIFSKNVYKRKQELMKYNNMLKKVSKQIGPLTAKLNKYLQPVTKSIQSYKWRFGQRKYYTFYKCPQCKNTLRLPKNRGKLKITCPKCKFEFIKKT